MSGPAVLIRGGFVVDGTGNPGYKADVEIADGRIAKLGRSISSDAQVELDAQNCVVSPGLIDMHSHGDLTMLLDRRSEYKLRQGVTTDVVGNCGFSPAPVRKERLNDLRQYLDAFIEPGYPWTWSRFRDFYGLLGKEGLGLNVAPLVGHGTLRMAAVGFDAREPSRAEVEDMKGLLANSLEEGAFGLSFGLEYAPALYAETHELLELAKVVAKYGGLCSFHMRNEGDRLLDAVKEVISVGKDADVSVEVSHLKAEGRDNWGKVVPALEMLRRARSEGVDVLCDVYPYTASSTLLSIILPPWVLDGGVSRMLDRLRNPRARRKMRDDIEKGLPGWGNMSKSCGDWSNIRINFCRKRRELIGKTVLEIAGPGEDPFDAACDLLVEEGGAVSAVFFAMNDADLVSVVKDPLSMIGSDSINVSSSQPHPRTYGSFARVFSRFVKSGALTIEDAIRKMTSLPARMLGLGDRGLLRPGCVADVAVFDLDATRDAEDYGNPRQFPTGMRHVLVGGNVALQDGHLREGLYGKVLTRDNSRNGKLGGR